MADKNVRYVIAADDAPFVAALKRVDGQLRDTSGRIGGLAEGLTGQFSRISGMVASVGALLAGGAFVAGIRNAIDLQDEMGKAAQRAGVSTEQFSSLAYAARLADVPVDELGKSMSKLSATLQDAKEGQKQAVEIFSRLKLDPANVKDADALLLELADRFERMTDPVAKTSLAMDVFGDKLGPKLVPFLNQGKAGIAELREEAARLGAVVSGETGQQAEAFNDNLTKLGVAAKAGANALATELLPTLVKASQYFVDAAKEAGFFQAILISIGALTAKALGLDDVGKLEGRYSQLRGEAERLENILVGVSNVLSRDPGNEQAQRRFANLTEKVKGLREEMVKTSVEIARMKSGLPDAGAGRGVAPPGTPKGINDLFTPGAKSTPAQGPVKEPPKPPDSYMAYYQERLAEEKRLQAVMTDGREYGKDEELAYWRFILDNASVTSKDKVAILKRTAELEVDIARSARRDRDELQRADIDISREVATARLEAERDAAQSLVATQEITREQLLALDAQFEERRYGIQRAAVEQRIALAEQDPSLSPAERRRLHAELELLELEHQRRLGTIQREQLAEARGPAMNVWKATENGMQSAIEGILNRTQSLRQGLVSIWGSIRQAITAELAKIIVAKIAAFARERVMALAEIGINATKAASGAAASQAGIPVVGPGMALAAMATMLAAVGGLSARVPSAEGGWSIPRGLNPLTQLHEQEMVLPKDEANAVRDMARRGSGGGGDAPPVILQGYRHGNFFITEVDALAKALDYARRNNHLRS